MQVMVEGSKFSRVELQKPTAPVHEKKGCDEGQTAINKNTVCNILLQSNLLLKIYISK